MYSNYLEFFCMKDVYLTACLHPSSLPSSFLLSFPLSFFLNYLYQCELMDIHTLGDNTVLLFFFFFCHCSSCSVLNHWELFCLGDQFLCQFSTSVWCSEITLYISCPSPKVHFFSRDLWFSLFAYIRNQDLSSISSLLTLF